MTRPNVGTCPICAEPRKARAENSFFPFCSRRCRQVDLGKWLGEEYRVPDRAVEESEDGAPPSANDPDAGGRGYDA